MVAVPFHDGLLNVDRGFGPTTLHESAVRDRLESLERPPSIEVIECVDPRLPEAARVVAVAGEVSRCVRGAAARGALPLVLAGDCNSCLGTVAGIGAEWLAVVWFDAHADYDTPDESRSGSLDAMGLAMLTGGAWSALLATIPGLAPFAETTSSLSAFAISTRPRRVGFAARGCGFSQGTTSLRPISPRRWTVSGGAPLACMSTSTSTCSIRARA